MRDPSHWFKPLIFVISLLPLLSMIYRGLFGTLGVHPVETLHHTFGDWTLRFLLFTLFITPLRLIPGWGWLLKLRRLLGLYAFFYATLHLVVYIVIDQHLDWSEIWSDIIKRPYITLGMSAYLFLLLLALTSSHDMAHRLGAYWTRLHSLIYPITLLGILHFYLLVKADVREPLIYGAIFAVLMILRIVLAGKKATRP